MKWQGHQVLYKQFSLTVITLLAVIKPITAAYYGSFEYTVENNEVTITGFLNKSTGRVVVPSVIDGLPVTKIGDHAFYECMSIEWVTLPESVTSIGNKAFVYCSLEGVDLPETLASIGDFAFSYCDLEKVFIPHSVTSIGTGPFTGCGRLIEINVSPENTNYSSADGILYNKSLSVIVMFPPGRAKDGSSILIPESVVSIGNGAFCGCRTLLEITIPNTVSRIGEFAFSNCDLLESVSIPDSVTVIGKGAFQACNALRTVFIPKSVASIGPGVFARCMALNQISVDSANPEYCSQNNIIFDKSCKTLIQFPSARGGDYVLPDNLTSIAERAFYGSLYLTSVTIPGSVRSIGDSAFSSCPKLLSLYMLGEPPGAGNLDLYDHYRNPIIYYIDGTPGWGNEFFGIPTAPFDPDWLWGKYEFLETSTSHYADTGDWMGWLEISASPWVWCFITRSWFLISETTAAAGMGWIYALDVSVGSDGFRLVMLENSNWGVNQQLQKWIYVPPITVTAGQGWIYLR